MRPIRRPARFRTRAVLVAVAAVLASCSDATGPDVARQDTPFYYYQDDRIYLRVDPTRLTVEPEAATDTSRIRTVLSRRGLTPDSIRAIALPGHWMVHLPAGTWARRAEDGARQLRLDDGIRFASVVYRLRDIDCALYPVNLLTVQFRTGADEAAIQQLNRATGVRDEQVHSWGTRAYRFPRGMAATPLELAAHYHRQHIVDWAELNLIDSCLRPAGGLP